MDSPEYHEKPATHYEYVISEINQLKQIEDVKHHAFLAMDLLEGWCTKYKASVLIDLIYLTKAKTIVEIGVWGGKSVIPMAYALKQRGEGKIYGIDPWSTIPSVEGMDGANKEWWGAVNHDDILQGLVNRIALFELKNQIKLIRSTSENALPIPDIDLLHIDGNHSEKSSYFDVCKWGPLVKPGGLIVFDDIDWTTTGQAVQWLDENCTKVAEYKDLNIWGVWIKS